MKYVQIRHARRIIWHLRAGGIPQVKQFLVRETPHATLSGQSHVRGAEAWWQGIGRRRKLNFIPANLDAPAPARADIHAGVVLDDFSLAGFQWEWSCHQLRPGMSLSEIQALNLNLLLIESAWNGNGGAWQHKLLGNNGPGREITNLICHAKSLGIPVIFWNKEDPPHYQDFLPLARMCDFVFTSDADMVPRYRTDLGHTRVAALPFAAQPRIHNPVRPQYGWHVRNVAFAGMYFSHKYQERREQMDYLLQGAADACARRRPGFEIFSRYLGKKPEYQFPGVLAKHVVGSLNYRQMLTAYKAYKIFLNVNSVLTSPSMCSRRVFEMTAAGAAVVSSPSTALEMFFPEGEIPLVRDRKDAAETISLLLDNPDLAERLVHRAQRRIWQDHTYGNRTQTILLAAAPQLVDELRRPRVSLLVSSIRPGQLNHVLAGVAAQVEVEVELIYGSHGFEFDQAEFDAKCRESGIKRYQYTAMPPEWELGDCLNYLATLATGEFAAKWDDDDLYGPYYIHDQVQAIRYSGADIVGKRAHYIRFLGPDMTVLRDASFEHRFSHFVAGPTLFGRLETFREFGFASVSQGEDTSFLARVVEAGGRIYAADRFNYYQVRSSNPDMHTWRVSASELMKSSTVKFFGSPEEQIFL